MMDIRNVRIKEKLQIIVISLFTLIFTVFTLTIYLEEKKAIEKIEKEKLQDLGYKYSTNIKSEMEKALETSKSISNIVSAMKIAEITDRKVVIENIKRVVEENKGLFGAWVVFEPNAFDGKDSEFAGQEGSAPDGRFVPYWNNSDNLHLEACVDYDKSGDSGYYYSGAKNSGKQIVTNPVSYKINGKDTTVVS